jgi:hypothetical protein
VPAAGGGQLSTDRDGAGVALVGVVHVDDLLLGQPDRIKTLKDVAELAAHLTDDVYAMFDLEARWPGIGSRVQDH